ncbi:AAA family ATPase [Rhodococcus sp. HM1]|uniref:DNA/RNA helicase domain-containing protein n=1 Tax=Rhodococcus sp. HM1 TaxID=2937759 RepID=UPI00200AB576|nr:DNA/RNA helicase domain-containing protein [Rhodococcus sp. HM1]MCK8673551.1 AAA family ATPase [Rhodococcus sp. HM1]
MSIRGYEDELRSERSCVAGLYARLDAERAEAKARYAAALRGSGGTLVDREVEVRTLAREVQRLNVAEGGLCFGRLDTPTGEVSYIGRIGMFDRTNEYEPLLLDWRAPAARPFYVATGSHPEGMRRRRQFHTRGREVVEFTDEVLGRPDGRDRGGRGDAALLAAVNAPREQGMRDIVATIQAEQDAIIRLDHPGVLVIEGGPGTGKTAVALHRVAYLLYTQRERMQRHGVLVVGPNPTLLDHIAHVLPSLGETNVVFATTGDLVPGLHVTAEDTAEAARSKGSVAILNVLTAAIADRQRLPQDPVLVELTDVTVRLDAEIARWARDEARASGLPHNQARAVFTDVVTWALTERAIARIGRGWLSRDDRAAWENLREDLRGELAENDVFTRVLDDLWPVLTPETLLSELFSSPARLRAAGGDDALLREHGDAWTVSDVPLLDELVDLLGTVDTVDAAESERKRETAYAAGVLDLMTNREDHMDDEDHLFATDLLYAEELADRFVERDTRDLAERAAADRDWTYGHVVVDEAQELSEMDWRTPTEIMTVAAALLAEFSPDTTPPESVRACGVAPWSRHVGDDDIASAIEEFVRDESGREGTSVVIGPPDVPGAVAAAETKGLEFDTVLVVDPDRILADGPRGAAELYVALTRATQRLGVLHRTPLPPALSGLVDISSSSGSEHDVAAGMRP